MAQLMAGVFASRGNYGLVFHGGDGLDELTTTTSSTVWVYADGEVEQLELDPLTLGVPRAPARTWRCDGERGSGHAGWSPVAGPVRDVVTLNAAAALSRTASLRLAAPRLQR
jgi:anthranilate phosphoribosyltransferase